MAVNKAKKNDTLEAEKTIYTVFKADGTAVSVEANSTEEAIKKAEASKGEEKQL